MGRQQNTDIEPIFLQANTDDISPEHDTNSHSDTILDTSFDGSITDYVPHKP